VPKSTPVKAVAGSLTRMSSVKTSVGASRPPFSVIGRTEVLRLVDLRPEDGVSFGVCRRPGPGRGGGIVGPQDHLRCERGGQDEDQTEESEERLVHRCSPSGSVMDR